MPNSQTIPVTHVGDVHITPALVLHNALYAPNFALDLISISCLLKNSCYSVTFQNSCCVIHDIHSQKRIDITREKQGFYYLEAVRKKDIKSVNSGVKSSLVNSGVESGCSLVNSNSSGCTQVVDKQNLWHFRLGHSSMPDYKFFIKHINQLYLALLLFVTFVILPNKDDLLCLLAIQ